MPEDYESKYPPIQVLTPQYYLLREDLWEYFRNKLYKYSYLRDIAFSWRNPYESKPYFIQIRDDSKTDFLDIQIIDPQIKVDLKYSTTNNFLHYDVYGDLERCFVLRKCANMLKEAHRYLREIHPDYKFLVFDGLRPRSVQYQMWELVKGTEQEKYVANPVYGSLHNYGAAVDLTIIDKRGRELDMGTPFDYFGKLAEPRYENYFLKDGKLNKRQIENRILLRETMIKAGFLHLSNEWWHFNQENIRDIKEKYKIVE